MPGGNAPSGDKDPRTFPDLLKDLTDFNEVSDFLFTALLIFILILMVSLIYTIINDKQFRKSLLTDLTLSLSSFFDAGSYFFSSFLGVRNRGVTSDRESIIAAQRVKDWLSQVESTHTLSNRSETEIVDLFRKAVSGNFSEQIANQLAALVDQKAKSSVSSASDQNLVDARDRLANSASSVSIRGVVSLLIGIIAAGGALYVLQGIAESLAIERVEELTYKTILYVALTRISLAIFITFISYFFLSLYKRSLDEIQQYQAEITNIDAWLSAISAARASGSEKIQAYTIARLMEVDRQMDRTSNHGKAGMAETNVKLSADLLKSLIEKIPS